MRFRLEQFLPGPLPVVEEALLDPAFIEELARLPNLGHPELLHQSAQGEIVRRRVRYAFSGELNQAVTKFVDPARLTWVEVSTHDRRTHVTTFEIQPDHYANRLSCTGRFTLREEGPATRRMAEGDLSVHIPFVGRKGEQAIISGLADHARLEAEILTDWIRSRKPS